MSDGPDGMSKEPELQIQHGYDWQPDVDSGPVKPSPAPDARVGPESPGLRVVPGGLEASSLSIDAGMPEPPPAPPELAPVVEFLRALARAVKAVRMYPPNNPVYIRFVGEMMEKLAGAFAGHDVLRLVVSQTRLHFKGETVYENLDSEDSLSRLLFRDGIREISFHLGLERDEMTRFLEMVRNSLNREAADDLVTQLWDGTLPHVTYLAIDDILDADPADTPVPPEFGSDFMNYIDFEIDFMDSDDTPASDEARKAAIDAAEAMRREILEGGNTEILTISPEEQAMLDAEIQNEDPTALMGRVLDTFFDVLDVDPEPASRGVLLAVLENAICSLVAQRQFLPAALILTGLREMEKRRPDVTAAHRQVIDGIFQAAVDPGRLEIVAAVLEGGGAVPLEEVGHYLRTLRPEAIPSLCELLGTVESRLGRRVMSRALADLSRGQAQVLLPFLQDERWYLVRNILAILGELKDPSTVKQIRPLVRHGELRVRREALAALSRIGRGEALDALHALLRDPDPRLRISAACSLGGLGATALNPLLQVVLAREFGEKSLEEKRGFFDALGRTGSAEVIPYLRMLLGKKPVFGRQQAEEMRVCAVEALARLSGPEAEALLAAAAGDPSSMVRAAVSGARRRRAGEVADDA